jgi:hypothetical protein
LFPGGAVVPKRSKSRAKYWASAYFGSYQVLLDFLERGRPAAALGSAVIESQSAGSLKIGHLDCGTGVLPRNISPTCNPPASRSELMNESAHQKLSNKLRSRTMIRKTFRTAALALPLVAMSGLAYAGPQWNPTKAPWKSVQNQTGPSVASKPYAQYVAPQQTGVWTR